MLFLPIILQQFFEEFHLFDPRLPAISFQQILFHSFVFRKKLQISKQQVLKEINHLKISKPSLAAAEMFGPLRQKILTSNATRFAGFLIKI